jgi:site-specific recombinase XerD
MQIEMASLVKQRSWYYLQFYDGKRNPQRKRIALKTRTKKTAEKLRLNLEDKYATGEYDPWTGFRSVSTGILVNQNSTVKEAVTYFIDKKSKEDWRENTIVNTSYVLKAFLRFIGNEKSVRAITPSAINGFLNQDKYAYETKKSHKAKLRGFANWLTKYEVVSYDYSEIKIFNRNEEQHETVSYLSIQEIKKLKNGIKRKVSSDIKKGYQSKNRNALWLIDFIDWQRLSGMRISETLNLRAKDINTDLWYVLHRF